MIVVSTVFQAKDYARMLEHKELTGGIMIRYTHPSLGVCYEVRYLPTQTAEESK